MRLQKYLSEHGICSRRRAEEHILAGRVRVNGETVTVLGTKVDPEKDLVEYDQEVVETPQKLRYVILNKPYGIVTSCLQKGEVTIKDLVDAKERLFPVGRLDKDSVGLVLLTNDGTLAYRLMHPKFLHEKEYVVDTEDPVTEGMLEKIAKGVKIEGVLTAPCKVTKIGPRRFRIVLKEGRNRQIRKMVSKVGTEVVKLERIRIENVRLGSLPQGAWRDLNFEEEYELFQRAGLVRHAEALKSANRKSPRKEPEVHMSEWAGKRLEKKAGASGHEEEPEENFFPEDFEKGEEDVSYFGGEEGNASGFAGRKTRAKRSRGQRLTDKESPEDLRSEIDHTPERNTRERGERSFGERKRTPRSRDGFRRPARARNMEKGARPGSFKNRREEEGYHERYGMGKPARDFERSGGKEGRPRFGKKPASGFKKEEGGRNRFGSRKPAGRSFKGSARGGLKRKK
ncbi:pseudouridine synthase [bacterium]|nr:pseudouridine synthase [bacterium]